MDDLATAQTEVEKAVEDLGPTYMTPMLQLKLTVSKLLHPLVHHYVPMKRYDTASRRLINTPYFTCIWCPRTKR
jgi:hypothetical protein